jgi:glycosyltransferase involved in cell wall biosynthesis
MKIIVFSPTSTTLTFLEDQPLGGADSTLLKMMEGLQDGHKVTGFLPVKTEQTYLGADVYPFTSIFDKEMECDIIILYRKIWAIPNNIKYKKAVFYSQDTADTPCFSGLKGNRKVLDFCSEVWALSEFHKKNLQTILDIPDKKIRIIGNSAEPQQLDVHRNQLKFVYASTPFRGLEVLLKAWQTIVQRHPAATLHVFSSMKIYGAEKLDDLHFGKMFNDLRTGRFKGVVFHGSRPHQEVIDSMKESYLLLYPCTYPETYCNVVMEARSCVLPFITSKLGALPETGGKAGYYIEGNARSPEYLQEFLRLVEVLIEDKERYDYLVGQCYPIRTFDDYEKDLLDAIEELRD